MVLETYGNIFDSIKDGYIPAIPVNAVGVMGAGLAKQFAKTFPQFFPMYRDAIKNRWLTADTPCMLSDNAENLSFIMFPTKYHWKNKSHIETINTALDRMKGIFQNYNNGYPVKVSLPPLGCGLGGLAYKDVRKLIIDKYALDRNFLIKLYKPKNK